MTKKKNELPVEEAANLHTDMEINDEVVSGCEDGSGIHEKESVCQTESEITASEEKEFEEKPKRKRKTAVKKNESDTEAKPSPEVADQIEKTPEA
ncbi:MAG: hypothetical protein E7587_09385, partial [Ruminococcaceae bacterium]|nr:hypothetical protein [Oscillospiraceae bacterium]